jgi:3-hydroxybutyryl-CoA dehydrogenase
MDTITVGILGDGNMGRQIALLCAAHAIPVVLWNHRAHENFDKEFKRLVTLHTKLGNIPKEAAETVAQHVQYVQDISAVASCDLIIESVVENMAIKSKILADVAGIITNARVVSSNTSTLSITELGSILSNPPQFVGVHFFNPPLSMKLVEVVKGEFTSDEAVSFVIEFLKSLGKQPVVLPETPGFVVNRLLFPMINEAIFLLADGVSDARTIDSCMKLGANHPLGPLELADLIGLDVCLHILTTLVTETGDGKYRPAPLLKKFVRAGKLGRKSGEGFYAYRRESQR